MKLISRKSLPWCATLLLVLWVTLNCMIEVKAGAYRDCAPQGVAPVVVDSEPATPTPQPSAKPAIGSTSKRMSPAPGTRPVPVAQPPGAQEAGTPGPQGDATSSPSSAEAGSNPLGVEPEPELGVRQQDKLPKGIGGTISHDETTGGTGIFRQCAPVGVAPVEPVPEREEVPIPQDSQERIPAASKSVADYHGRFIACDSQNKARKFWDYEKMLGLRTYSVQLVKKDGEYRVADEQEVKRGEADCKDVYFNKDKKAVGIVQEGMKVCPEEGSFQPTIVPGLVLRKTGEWKRVAHMALDDSNPRTALAWRQLACTEGIFGKKSQEASVGRVLSAQGSKVPELSGILFLSSFTESEKSIRLFQYDKGVLGETQKEKVGFVCEKGPVCLSTATASPVDCSRQVDSPESSENTSRIGSPEIEVPGGEDAREPSRSRDTSSAQTRPTAQALPPDIPWVCPDGSDKCLQRFRGTAQPVQRRE